MKKLNFSILLQSKFCKFLSTSPIYYCLLGIILYFIILCYIKLCYIILYQLYYIIIFYYIILYYIILYYIISYHIISYHISYIILCYIILCYIIYCYYVVLYYILTVCFAMLIYVIICHYKFSILYLFLYFINSLCIMYHYYFMNFDMSIWRTNLDMGRWRNLFYFDSRKSSPIRILNASTEVSGSKPEETTDGLHYSERIIKIVSKLIYFACPDMYTRLLCRNLVFKWYKKWIMTNVVFIGLFFLGRAYCYLGLLHQ